MPTKYQTILNLLQTYLFDKGISLHGTIGNLYVFRVRKINGKLHQECYAYKYVEPEITPARALCREAMFNAVQGWKDLSESEKGSWRALENGGTIKDGRRWYYSRYIKTYLAQF